MMPEKDFISLDWDSSFLGIITGMITRQGLQHKEIEEILGKMKDDGYRLVYYPSVKKIEQSICNQYNGILTDEKVTFAKSIGSDRLENSDIHIKPYDQNEVSPELLELAFQSGIYSRFNVDPNFKHNEYRQLYKIWIERSVNKQIAKEVLVYIEGRIMGGMITLGEKNNRGDIGLVAVAASSRGKGIGKKLMVAAENFFQQNGYQQVQVITQGINTPAMNLYQSSGYSMEEKLFYYHFWL